MNEGFQFDFSIILNYRSTYGECAYLIYSLALNFLSTYGGGA